VGLFSSLRISQKLPLALVGSAILVAAGVGAVSYILGSAALKEQATQNLSTVAFERANQLSMVMGEMQDDIGISAQSPEVLDALRAFSLAWFSVKDDVEALRKSIADNPASPEERINLDKFDSNFATYMATHFIYQPIFRKKVQGAGFHDLYIFDTLGHLMYSATKADDFATGFAEGDGPHADSVLGRAFRSAIALETPGSTTLQDFAAYAPAGGDALTVIAAPIFVGTEKSGVLAVSVDPKEVAGNISYRNGLGVSGDVTIVGVDGLARSDSAFTSEMDVLQPGPFDAVIESAVTGVPGTTELPSFRDATVIAAAAPADITPELSWAVVATMNKDEILTPITHLGQMMLGIGAALLALVAVAGLFFARRISQPISKLTTTMDLLAAGNLDVEVSGSHRRDEIGAMARSVEVFRENALKISSMTEEERAASERRRIERTDMMQQLQRSFGEVVDGAVEGDFSKRVTASFADAEMNNLARSVNNLVNTVEVGLRETGDVLAALASQDLTVRMTGEHHGAFGRLKDDINAVIDTLSVFVGGLKRTSNSLRTATREILSGANDLSERTTKQAATIEETSATMETLSGTVVENAQRAEQASAMAEAVSQTATEGGAVMGRATDAMERITSSSSKISNIIGLIDDIAFQTNLLALNASVEAARAGEAGKGFAVVAVEVRRLAQSAAEASSEVKVLIEQSGAEVASGSRLVAEAAAKLGAMLEAARQNRDLLSSIAGENRAQASQIAEVNIAVRTLDEMTQHNAALVEETNAAIEQTEAQASELDKVVEVFRVEADRTRGDAARPIVPASKPQKPSRPIHRSEGNAAISTEWNEF
jgi:methyl-accepting chemotaxis protein